MEICDFPLLQIFFPRALQKTSPAKLYTFFFKLFYKIYNFNDFHDSYILCTKHYLISFRIRVADSSVLSSQGDILDTLLLFPRLPWPLLKKHDFAMTFMICMTCKHPV